MSLLQWSDTGYITLTPGEVPCSGIVSQHNMDFYGIFVDLLIHFVSLGILCFISFCFVCSDFHLGQVVFYPVFFFSEKART